MYRSQEIASRLVVTFLTCIVFSLTCSAQQKQDVFPPELTPDDSILTRSIGGDIVSGSDAFKFRPKFKFKRTIPKPKPKPTNAGPKSGAKAEPYSLPDKDSSPAVWEKVGVTIWKATETTAVTPEKETARLLTQDGGRTKELLPVRVSSDTVFNMGDKVRISIESPRAGYLYIIDREILGKDIRGEDILGPPHQIFPTMLAHNGNNKVQSGIITDIPAQSDNASFFDMGSKTPGYRGEMLTIILSPDPLKDFGTPSGQVEISPDLADEVDKKYASEVGEYEQQGTDGKPYTKAEKAAGADATRQLTQGDPYPQTVYRVKSRQRTPILLNIRLSVR